MAGRKAIARQIPPIAVLLGNGRLDPGDVHRAAEVALVLGHGEPACLAGCFAGRSAGGDRAAPLVMAVTRVWTK
jgi:hypothetical protein